MERKVLVENSLEKKMKVILEAIDKGKGEDIVVFDFTSVSPFIDRVIITSANNMRKVHAIADRIKEQCREYDFAVRMEGNQDSKWILLDAGEVIVHVFYDEERDVYRLERLYGDLPRWEGQYDL